jgi:hypothetical protein
VFVLASHRPEGTPLVYTVDDRSGVPQARVAGWAPASQRQNDI